MRNPVTCAPIVKSSIRYPRDQCNDSNDSHIPERCGSPKEEFHLPLCAVQRNSPQG